MNVISRRKLFSSTMLGGAALTVAACSTAQISSFEAEWTTIVDQVQAAVSTAASLVKQGLAYLPTAESVAEEFAAMLGPTWQAAVAAGAVVLNQITSVISALISAASNVTPAAAARLRSKLHAAAPNVRIFIGVTPQGVQVSGYRV